MVNRNRKTRGFSDVWYWGAGCARFPEAGCANRGRFWAPFGSPKGFFLSYSG